MTSNYGPGGITWSSANVATVPEIVNTFDAFSDTDVEGLPVTDETYINCRMMTLDFDYMMGHLIEAVDRGTGQCTYVAIVHYHGRHSDGTFEHDFRAWPGTHTFFGKDDGYDRATVTKWAVDFIHNCIETRYEAYNG